MAVQHLMLVVVVAACRSGASSPIANRSDRADPVAPTRDELIELLKPHAGHPLAATNGCPDTETLGVWVARLVEYGSPKQDGDIHRLTGTCGPHATTMNAPPTTREEAEAYWSCSLDAYASDPAGESPWSCGLIVRIRKADRSVELGSLGCPGTC